MKKQDWRGKYRFHPKIIDWIDSIVTHDQLLNAIARLPDLAENNRQKNSILLYLTCKCHEMTRANYEAIFK